MFEISFESAESLQILAFKTGSCIEGLIKSGITEIAESPKVTLHDDHVT